MMASFYFELVTWRALQYRYGRLDDVGEMNERKTSFSEKKNISWYSRNRIFIVAGAFSSVIGTV